jgi:SnoaL-like domain
MGELLGLPTKNSAEVVTKYLKAMQERNFKRARSYMDDDFSFVGPLASHKTPEEHLKVMDQLRPEYDIKKVFEDNDDVCVIYDITTKFVSASEITCAWFQLRNGKIFSLRSIFDPRAYVAMPEVKSK